MKVKSIEETKYKDDAESISSYYRELPLVIDRLVESWNTDHWADHGEPVPMPSHESVVRIIHRARNILFPGYFIQTRLDPVNMGYYLGQETTALFEELSKQIILSIQHHCFRFKRPCSQCIQRGHETGIAFVQALPGLRSLLASDVQATLEGDPAARSYDEVIFSYPGIFAITVYRLAHTLWSLYVPLLPRIMTEYAHGQTGIDIHPGARIGESLCIDHGTGVVVGETTEIGNRVRLYQGVTLGALSLPGDAGSRFKDRKRHPTIEDDVIIYSNTTVLGGDTVIGARSIIGGNVWVTESVPPDTKVLHKRPELVYIGNGKKSAAM